jgi:hypothetical protein
MRGGMLDDVSFCLTIFSIGKGVIGFLLAWLAHDTPFLLLLVDGLVSSGVSWVTDLRL